MALFKYFKKVEHTVSECAQASGLKEHEENEVQKQLQSISEPQFEDFFLVNHCQFPRQGVKMTEGN